MKWKPDNIGPEKYLKPWEILWESLTFSPLHGKCLKLIERIANMHKFGPPPSYPNFKILGMKINFKRSRRCWVAVLRERGQPLCFRGENSQAHEEPRSLRLVQDLRGNRTRCKCNFLKFWIVDWHGVLGRTTRGRIPAWRGASVVLAGRGRLRG